MKRTGIALLSTAALLAASGAYAASADDISWTYLDAGWVNADGNDSASTDGWNVNGSLGFLDSFYVQAGYSSLNSDSDLNFRDFDTDTWNIAVGYHAGLNEKSEVFASVGYFDGNSDGSGTDGGEGGSFTIDNDTDGFSLTTGVRYRATDSVEMGGALVYTDGESDDDGDFNDTSVALYGAYFVIPAWSVGVRASLSGGGGGNTAIAGDTLTLYTRYEFGELLSR